MSYQPYCDHKNVEGILYSVAGFLVTHECHPFMENRKEFIKHHNCNRNGNKGYDDHDHGVDSESNYGRDIKFYYINDDVDANEDDDDDDDSDDDDVDDDVDHDDDDGGGVDDDDDDDDYEEDDEKNTDDDTDDDDDDG